MPFAVHRLSAASDHSLRRRRSVRLGSVWFGYAGAKHRGGAPELAHAPLLGTECSAGPLQNYCLSDHVNWYIAAAFVAITLTIVFAFPLNIFPVRFTLEVAARSDSICYSRLYAAFIHSFGRVGLGLADPLSLPPPCVLAPLLCDSRTNGGHLPAPSRHGCVPRLACKRNAHSHRLAVR